MNVGELKKMLDGYPDEMLVLNRRYSDYEVIIDSDWSVIKGVNKGFYVMNSHPTMDDENKLNEQEFLLLEGN